jgi:raffinose/stachyose/melibiose transport system permease protein
LRGRFALGFVGPALLLYGAFVLLPGLAALAWAFTRWDGISARSWAGLFNFKWLLLESDTFWSALGNNLFLMVVPALVVVPAALLLAVFIHRGGRGAKVFQMVLLFPNLLGGVAAALLWLNAYNPHSGLVNAALVKFGGLLAAAHAPAGWAAWFRAFDGFPWLAQAHLYPALIPIYLWMACGFNLVLYLAAMQGIPAELYEAAELEGASKVRQFFTITLPLIREVLVVSAVFLVIGGLNAFELVWLLTNQAPASGTHTLGTLMVSTMFQDFQIGRATAIAVVMFVLVLAGSAAVMRALRREAVER